MPVPMPTVRAPRRCFAASLAIAVALLAMAACGGGTAEQAAPVKTLQVDGCVVDQYFIPSEGVAVRAVGADGRVLGRSLSDSKGTFSMHIAPRQAAALVLEREEVERMALPETDRDVQLGNCLVASDLG